MAALEAAFAGRIAIESAQMIPFTTVCLTMGLVPGGGPLFGIGSSPPPVTPAGGAGLPFGVILAISTVVVLAGVAAIAGLWFLKRRAEEQASGELFPLSPTGTAPGGPAMIAAADEITQPIAPSAPPAPPEPPRKAAPLTEAIRAVENEGDFDRAADLWRERADFPRERAALLHTDQIGRLASLEMALGMLKEASTRLTKALSIAPSDEDLRLRLVQALLDLGEIDEAYALTEVVTAAGSPLSASGQFIARAARSFEAAGRLDTALELYRAASKKDNAPPETAPRIVYLHQLQRLKDAPPLEGTTHLPKGFLRQALDESQAEYLRSGKPGEDPPTSESWVLPDDLSDHQVIVGHLALGSMENEPKHSVRSVASRASRFTLTRLVSERPSTAVFEGMDSLLDCPVAIRLCRVPERGRDYEILCGRLKAISRLNHPNLTKTTYADRCGRVIRVVSDFHTGGSLATLMDKLERMGLPLTVRILMQVASGIGAAHRAGVMHGDLRPQNVMIGHDNLIKVVDFALHPWPVRDMPPDQTPRVGNPAGMLEHEIQTDITQFADLCDFLLSNTTLPAPLKQNANVYDPVEELREVASHAREGEFASIIYIHRILVQVLDRLLPR